MKNVKIILSIIFLGFVGTLVYLLFSTIIPPPPPPPEKDYFKRIENQIDSLEFEPENKLNLEKFNRITYTIKKYAESGLLDSIKQDNDTKREILEKDLISVYSVKFVKQAMYVFQRSEWRQTDISQIRLGVNALINSPYLRRGTSVANDLENFISIIAKYDEITAFVDSCKNLSVPIDQVDSKFPDVSDKIRRSKQYLSEGLENSYVNNCLRLREDLENVPEFLFESNKRFILAKINLLGPKCAEFSSQNDFNKNISQKIGYEIDNLKYIYGDYFDNDDISNKIYTLDSLKNKYLIEKCYDYFKMIEKN